MVFLVLVLIAGGCFSGRTEAAADSAVLGLLGAQQTQSGGQGSLGQAAGGAQHLQGHQGLSLARPRRAAHKAGYAPFVLSSLVHRCWHVLRTPQEYMSVFEPLLLEECCAQVLRGVEEGEVLSPHPCVASKCEPVRLVASAARPWTRVP